MQTQGQNGPGYLGDLALTETTRERRYMFEDDWDSFERRAHTSNAGAQSACSAPWPFTRCLVGIQTWPCGRSTPADASTSLYYAADLAEILSYIAGATAA